MLVLRKQQLESAADTAALAAFAVPGVAVVVAAAGPCCWMELQERARRLDCLAPAAAFVVVVAAAAAVAGPTQTSFRQIRWQW
jgi:hypothetical protein